MRMDPLENRAVDAVEDVSARVVAAPLPQPLRRLAEAHREGRKQAVDKRRQVARANVSEPIDHQQAHSPTEAVEVTVPVVEEHPLLGSRVVRKTVERCQRRIVDARLWDAMSDAQQDAALCIAAAYASITAGLGYQPSRVELGHGRTWDGVEGGAAIQADYFRWAVETQKQRLHHAQVVDVLIAGHAPRAIDKARRQRNGAAWANLVACLDIWCRQHGWI